MSPRGPGIRLVRGDRRAAGDYSRRGGGGGGWAEREPRERGDGEGGPRDVGPAGRLPACETVAVRQGAGEDGGGVGDGSASAAAAEGDVLFWEVADGLVLGHGAECEV